MPRVMTVEKNRKAQECRRCGATIKVGEGYRHWSFRYGGKVTRCLTCPMPRQSELTQSGYLQQVYGAQEAFSDAIDEVPTDDWEACRDGVVALLEEAQSVASDVRDEYQEALDAWEHGNSMLEEKVEAAESWHDEIENVKNDLENDEPDMPDEPDKEDPDYDADEYEAEKQQAIDDYCQQAVSTASDAVENCDL